MTKQRGGLFSFQLSKNGAPSGNTVAGVPAPASSTNGAMTKIGSRLQSAKNSVQKALQSDPILFRIFGAILLVVVVYYVYQTVQYYRASCNGEKPGLWNYLFGGEKICPNQAPLRSPLTSMKDLITATENVVEKKEVFHIRDQVYTYDQAKCKCASYGAELATYEQMVDAYNQGADWCSYGWSHGQKAYYPTQQATFDRLQSGPDAFKKSCGNPGINGGYFSNPTIRFGINCYGVKPKGRVVKPRAVKPPAPPKPVDVCALPANKDKVARSEMDEIAPFNADQWNN